MVNMYKSVKVAVAMKGYKSIQEFATRSGINYQQIIFWANGDRDPRLTSLERLASAFDMKVSEFVALGEN